MLTASRSSTLNLEIEIVRLSMVGICMHAGTKRPHTTCRKKFKFTVLEGKANLAIFHFIA
jgi:hypothetical protein